MAWNRVQGFSVAGTNYTDGNPHANTAVALSSPVAVGDLIVLVTTVGADPSTLTASCADNLGNTYTRLLSANGGQQFDSTNTQGAEVFYSIVTVAGTPTITYTPHTAGEPFIAFKGSHFTGSDASTTRRDSKGANQNNPGTGTDAITTASVAALSGDLLWLGGGCVGIASTATVGGTSFTASAVDTSTSLIDEWKTATGAGAGTLTDATNGGARRYLTTALAFSPGTQVVLPRASYPIHGRRG